MLVPEELAGEWSGAFRGCTAREMQRRLSGVLGLAAKGRLCLTSTAVMLKLSDERLEGLVFVRK